jgi:hypothetical protein
VLELAAACLRFVMAAVRFELDFTRETLPVLDHYLAGARVAVRERPETLPLVASACGAYLGEVVRRVHPCWWRIDDPDPLEWRLEFRDVFLSFRPGRVVEAALSRPEPAPGPPHDDDVAAEPPDDGDEHSTFGDEPDEQSDAAAALGSALGQALGSLDSDGADGAAAEEAAFEPGLVIDDRARVIVRGRLDRLPPVPEDEYWAPSTRVEVVDIVVDALKNQELNSHDPRPSLRPEDYDE